MSDWNRLEVQRVIVRRHRCEQSGETFDYLIVDADNLQRAIAVKTRAHVLELVPALRPRHIECECSPEDRAAMVLLTAELRVRSGLGEALTW